MGDLKAEIMRDLLQKAAADVSEAAMRNAALLDTHDDRFRILVACAVACIGLADGAFQAKHGESNKAAVFDAIRAFLTNGADDGK